MKKAILLAVSALVFLALTACNEYNEYSESDLYFPVLHQHEPEILLIIQENDARNDKLSYWHGFHMHIDPCSVTPTGLRLAMINNTDFYFGHGVMFNIERHLNGEWEQVPFIGDAFWILPLLISHPNTISEENIDWSHMHGELPPGQYRLVRNFMNMGDNMWQDGGDEHLYALFTVEDDWQDAFAIWQADQDDIRARAYARFDGLDLDITDFSLTGLSFTLTNNNPDNSYVIHSVFVGWSDFFPEGGHAAAIEYFVFPPMPPRPSSLFSWPFEGEVVLQQGESISVDVDWYAEIGYIYPAWRPYSPYPTVFELVVDVSLDADEVCIENIHRHIIPGVPGSGLRLTAEFDVTEL